MLPPCPHPPQPAAPMPPPPARQPRPSRPSAEQHGLGAVSHAAAGTPSTSSVTRTASDATGTSLLHPPLRAMPQHAVATFSLHSSKRTDGGP